MQGSLEADGHIRPDDQAEMLDAGIKAYGRICDFWKLKNTEAAALLDVELRTWNRIKAGTWSGKLTQDQVLRLSAFVGLYKGLHLYFGDELADRWPTLANSGPPFTGLTPIDYIARGGLPALLATRNYVDAIRGGM